jgi:hypothetical protein
MRCNAGLTEMRRITAKTRATNFDIVKYLSLALVHLAHSRRVTQDCLRTEQVD